MREIKNYIMIPIVLLLLTFGCGGSSTSPIFSTGLQPAQPTSEGSDEGSDEDSEDDAENEEELDCEGSSPFRLPFDEEIFYGSSEAEEVTYGGGDTTYSIFNLFRNYEFPRDEGIIDTSNVYKFLFEALNHYNQAICRVRELEEPALIASMYDFGNEPRLYTHASDHYALTKEGDTIYALINWIWNESPKMSYMVMEGNINTTTGGLELNATYLVDYPPSGPNGGSGDYCIRTYISGNILTREIVVKSLVNGSKEGSGATSQVGTGVVMSENSDDYFLIKMKANYQLSGYPDGRYFRFSFPVSEDYFIDYPPLGYDIGDIEDPNDLASVIEPLDFFDLSGADNATSVSEFRNEELNLLIEDDEDEEDTGQNCSELVLPFDKEIFYGSAEEDLEMFGDLGDPTRELAYIYQDYEFPRDEGVLDMSNVYKLLFETINSYSNSCCSAEELEEPATIISPFDFGNESKVYTHAGDHSAFGREGDNIDFLLTQVSEAGSPTMGYNVMEGSINSVTGELVLDYVGMVDYTPGGDGDYCTRTHLEGNVYTREITLKTLKNGTGEGSYALSTVSKGVVKSDSESDYILMKMIDNSKLSDYPDGRYYKFSSPLDIDYLKEYQSVGYPLGSISDPNKYGDVIGLLEFFDLSGSENATSTDDFSNPALTLQH